LYWIYSFPVKAFRTQGTAIFADGKIYNVIAHPFWPLPLSRIRVSASCWLTAVYTESNLPRNVISVAAFACILSQLSSSAAERRLAWERTPAGPVVSLRHLKNGSLHFTQKQV
jgi:hypothetical protein